MARDAMDAEVNQAQTQSVWMKLFSSASKPYSKAILALTGNAFPEMAARESDEDLDSRISCATTSIHLAEISLDKLGIRSGSTIVTKARGKEEALSNDLFNTSCPLPLPLTSRHPRKHITC
jgi:hypothetical protein